MTEPEVEVRQAAGLVAYQEGAVVSRTVVKRASGSVTVFAFAEGQALSEHTVPFDALVYLLEGTAEITVAGVRHRLEAGDLLLMPADRPHAVRAERNFKMILSMLRS